MHVPKSNYLKIENSSFVGPVITGGNYQNQVIQFVGGNDIIFDECDFRFVRFVDCYFAKCTFLNCDFTGSKFTDSNIRRSEFKGCIFDYCDLKSTKIDYSCLQASLPERPNLKRRFLQALRKNYETLGDTTSVRKVIWDEIEAEKEYLAIASSNVKDDYYRGKYPKKIVAWIHYVSLKLGWLTWGYGEYPSRILIFIAFFILSISAFSIAISNLEFCYSIACFSDGLSIFGATLNDASLGFLGLSHPIEGSQLTLWGRVLLSIVRFVAISLFTSSLVKRFGWR